MPAKIKKLESRCPVKRGGCGKVIDSRSKFCRGCDPRPPGEISLETGEQEPFV